MSTPRGSRNLGAARRFLGSHRGSRVGNALRALALPAAVLLFVELYMRHYHIESDAFVRPTEAWQSLLDSVRDHSLLDATRETLAAALLSVGIGGLIGLVCGLWTGLSPGAEERSSLATDMLRPLPSVALIPISMMVFGLNLKMEVAVVSYSCIWPMWILTHAAVRGVEPQLYDVASMLRLSLTARVFKIVLPAIVPHIVVALRLTLSVALVVAITVEIAGNPSGLGYLIVSSQQSLLPGVMWAAVAWVAVLGWLLNGILQTAQQMWHVSAILEEPS